MRQTVHEGSLAVAGNGWQDSVNARTRSSPKRREQFPSAMPGIDSLVQRDGFGPSSLLSDGPSREAIRIAHSNSIAAIGNALWRVPTEFGILLAAVVGSELITPCRTLGFNE